jgi:hypothetical protein
MANLMSTRVPHSEIYLGHRAKQRLNLGLRDCSVDNGGAKT